jgi:hypothetical protein
LDLIKEAGKDEVLGKVQACITGGGSLCITFSSAAGGETLNMIKVGVFNSLEDLRSKNINTSPQNFLTVNNLKGKTNGKICFSLQALVDAGVLTVKDPSGNPATDFGYLQGQTIYLTAEASFRGDPAAGLPGGQAWAGTKSENGQYPFDRYFEFSIARLNCNVNPPTGDVCLFTQGYWFAKPNVVWPNSTFTLGNQTYDIGEAREIFRSTNKGGKTAAKQAFLQAAALTLSLDNTTNQEGAVAALCPGVLDALSRINTYFSTKGEQTGETLNALTAKNESLRADADLISDCLNNPANTCD